MRCVVWTTLIAGAVFGLSDVALHYGNARYRVSMENLQTQEKLVAQSEKRRGALMKRLLDKARFAAERSTATVLLSDLQTIFPENAWAESISIVAGEDHTFTGDIQGYAVSSGLINTVLTNIRSVSGTSNAKLAYSEQVTLPDKSRAIRFKVEFDWK